jgi:hypothetical protein
VPCARCACRQRNQAISWSTSAFRVLAYQYRTTLLKDYCCHTKHHLQNWQKIHTLELVARYTCCVNKFEFTRYTNEFHSENIRPNHARRIKWRKAFLNGGRFHNVFCSISFDSLYNSRTRCRTRPCTHTHTHTHLPGIVNVIRPHIDTKWKANLGLSRRSIPLLCYTLPSELLCKLRSE